MHPICPADRPGAHIAGALAGLAVAMLWLVVAPLPARAGSGAAADRSPAVSADAEVPAKSVGGRFVLSTHDGRIVTDENFRGKHLLVFFGYTHCPDICPTSLQAVGAALDLLGPAAKDVQPLFISLDPERDTPALLAAYVANFHRSLIGLRGSPAMMERLTKAYGVRSERIATPGGDKSNYTIDHTAVVFHMGPDGNYLGRFGHSTTADDIASRLRTILTQ